MYYINKGFLRGSVFPLKRKKKQRNKPLGVRENLSIRKDIPKFGMFFVHRVKIKKTNSFYKHN